MKRSNRGFSLIELMIYLSVSSLVFSSVIAFSLYVNKTVGENSLRLKQAQTTDLIFRVYKKNLKPSSNLIFLCDENGARIKYGNTNTVYQIGELPSKNCQLSNGLIFEI